MPTLPALLLSLLSAARGSQQDQPFFPVFHVRPPAGHVNDPNGPFRDPTTGYIHLFMQYCPRGKCFGQVAPGNHTPNYQSATHFYSKDGGAHWTWTGNASGVVAACDPLDPGQCPPSESASDCPDDLGVYSGSTTIVDGVPSYAYPGVHLYDYDGDSSAVTMTQCIATPADPADPTLAKWRKRTIISHKQVPKGISQHFHDDSTAFQMNGRWWIFMGSAACGGKPTGDCPYPDPSVAGSRGRGVNYLFSAENFTGPWRAEHSLFNTSSFVSCPEFYTLPGMKTDQYIYHAMGAKNVFGTFDTKNMLFRPDVDQAPGKYDNGDGRASKSYWDAKTQRRIMWSWIAGSFPCHNPQGFECDSMQSVPRVITYDSELEILRIEPIAEVERLRTGLLASASKVTVASPPVAIKGAAGATLDIAVNFTCTDPASSAVVSAQGSVSGSTKVLNNTNLPRGDIKGLDFPLPAGITDAAGIAACAAFCANHSRVCKAWVFVRDPQHRCAIKGPHFCAPAADRGTISGIMSGVKPDPNCQAKPPHPGPPSPPLPAGKCSGELRVRGSADGAHYMGVGFSCPAPHQPGDCHLITRSHSSLDSRSSSSSSNATSAAGGAKDEGGAAVVTVPFSAASPFDGTFNLRVLVDTSVVEVYAHHGRAIDTVLYIPPSAADVSVSLAGQGEGVTAAVEVHGMGTVYA
jgi:sucrose-6-phosphate hydrolase SacC (GH32 family)